MKKVVPTLVNKKALSAGLGLLTLSVVTAFPAFAQEGAKAEVKSDLDVLISNPLFLSLSFAIVALLLIIYSLKGVMGSLAAYKLAEIKSDKAAKISAVLILMLVGSSAFAQEAAKAGDAGIGGLPSSLVYGMLFVLVLELLVVAMLLQAIRFIIKSAMPVVDKEEESAVTNFLDSFNASVSLEDEEDILMDHDYDGIKELDNNLPPWWKYGFYFTIVFSLVYLVYYHMGGGGKSSIEEYKQQLADAKIQIEEYRKKAGNRVDETNAKMLTGADILSGKEVYDVNCAACHGKLGEGGVGPNLTDDYWLHGGSIKDIFKTIKYGFAEKGMKAWEADLSPLQINQVASYIKSLRGTNPPNAKEKQGELFLEENDGTSRSDSTATIEAVDSLKLADNK